MNIISKWKNVFYECAALFLNLTFKLSIVFDETKCVNEILFYGADEKEQRRQVGLNNLLCICYTILHATKTIDMCIPRLRSETICKCLSNVRQKSDVAIRLILYDANKKRYIEMLKKHGVEVKVVHSKIQLQHEFILIDANESEDAVAIIGSLDYDVANVNLNRDSTLLISDNKIILPLKREFERIWDKSYVENIQIHKCNVI